MWKSPVWIELAHFFKQIANELTKNPKKATKKNKITAAKQNKRPKNTRSK